MANDKLYNLLHHIPMRIVFLSNFYNHHQGPLSESMNRLTEGNYHFIETEPIQAERENMGWGIANYPHYVRRLYDNENERAFCKRLIDEADVVITGSAPEYLIKGRLKKNKLTFRYSERIYKAGCKRYELPARRILYHFRHGRYDNLYLLCASAYTASDYAKTGTFLNKAYKWGYFPEVKQYKNIDSLISNKKQNSILWVARFIGYKHPETCIQIGRRLRDEGYQFEINLIGNGINEAEVQSLIDANNLQNFVHLLGAMPPDKVREHMETAGIFLFTSDFNEGWGAVLNESMNSGCAVVASHAIGSVPFLIKHDKNGLIYQNGNLEDLYQKVKWLLDDPSKQKKFGKQAYKTMVNHWNADLAAERFIQLAQEILNGNKSPDLFPVGICSKAEIIKNDWWTYA
ncbi:MAG TPA: hypothetical protein DEG06_04770 [Lachnospiraceae bacterium]|nr:hypothetical protein [Lachnospiraceae bacterium]